MLTRILAAVLFLVMLLTTVLSITLPAQAGLVIQGSRIIYEEAAGEVSVQMQYVGDSPTLLQAWIETEDDSGSAPGAGEVPFILMPAVARLDPGNGQTIRILRTGDGLPQNRESVFYFNTLEVPPAPTEQIAAGDAFMQFSIRGQFKLFYRPKGLLVSSEKAIEMLQFSLAEPAEDGRVQLRVRNTSPYHVTFSTIRLRQPGAAQDSEALVSFLHDAPSARMVLPFSELVLPMEWTALSPGAQVPAECEVDFAIINDAGGVQSRQQKVQG